MKIENFDKFSKEKRKKQNSYIRFTQYNTTSIYPLRLEKRSEQKTLRISFHHISL